MKQKLQYKLKRNKKSKRVSLTVNCNGCVSVTSPVWVPKYVIDKFVQSKKQWIQDRIKFFNNPASQPVRKFSQADYLAHKAEAMRLVEARVEFYNKIYNFSFNKISIKNQKTRWGSCSSKGNLNFNYKILFLSEELRDYIIVHELCHLAEMNHSKSFWSLVAKVCPDYLELRKRLRKIEILYR